MTSEERQAAIDSISEEDIAKIQSKIGKKIKVEDEDIVEAEFLMKFGWGAYWALYPEKDPKNGIDTTEMARLLTASRKVEAADTYNAAVASFVGAVSSRARSPASIFKKLTSNLIKSTKADK